MIQRPTSRYECEQPNKSKPNQKKKKKNWKYCKSDGAITGVGVYLYLNQSLSINALINKRQSKVDRSIDWLSYWSIPVHFNSMCYLKLQKAEQAVLANGCLLVLGYNGDRSIDRSFVRSVLLHNSQLLLIEMRHEEQRGTDDRPCTTFHWRKMGRFYSKRGNLQLKDNRLRQLQLRLRSSSWG